jgi:hypothetical protein
MLCQASYACGIQVRSDTADAWKQGDWGVTIAERHAVVARRTIQESWGAIEEQVMSIRELSASSKNTTLLASATCLALFAISASASGKEYESGIKWLEPKVIEPGAKCGDAPSDATILFDGKDLSKWEGADKWEVRDGYAIPHGHDIKTRDAFGDCQLHVEWATPSVVSGSGQGRGNSGVYLMEKYEVQILDSYENKTYFDG